MARHSSPALLCFVIFGLLAQSAHAQPQIPSQVTRLATVMPAGAKVGTTVDVTVGGQDLDDVSALYFSHASIKAEKVGEAPKSEKPKPPPQGMRGQGQGPVMTAKFKVTVPANTPVGLYDIRVIGKWGVSNPRVFAVGDLHEVTEKEPNNDVPEAQKIDLNTTINGVIGGNVDVDYFSFKGTKGQRVVVHCATASIDSRSTPLVQVFDSANHQLASNRNYRDRDAVADALLPADGEYFIRLSEFAYLGGGPEYFYRLTVTTAPWIDAAFPAVVEPGKTTAVSFYGRNLPNGQVDPMVTLDGRPLEKAVVQVTPPEGAMAAQRLALDDALPSRSGGLDGFEFRLSNATGASNPFLLTYAAAPVVLAQEEHAQPDQPQEIAVPCELCGRIDRRRDRDAFLFSAKGKEAFVVEGFADRLGMPMDLYFKILRFDDKQVLAEVDDNPDQPGLIGKFFSRSDDPKARFVAPTDGKYLLIVGSRSSNDLSGPRHAYRLSLRKEHPDFRLVLIGNSDLAPGGCTVRQGGNQDLQVVCFRQDGFMGQVQLTVDGLPDGVVCPPQFLGPNLRQTALVFSAAEKAAAWAGEIKIKGTATIDGKTVEREARAGCIVWPTLQPNIPAVSRMARSICLAVRDRGPFSLGTSVKELLLLAGGNAEIKIQVKRNQADFKTPVQLVRVSAPGGLNGQPIPIPNVIISGTEGTVRFSLPNSTPPGIYNLVFQGTAQTQAQRQNRRGGIAQLTEVTPPIRVTVFNSVLELSFNPADVVLKPGAETPLVVKVNRLHGFKGEIRLQLTTPNNLQGVSAAPATIAAGEEQTTLVLKAAANAKPASSSDVRVRATAQFNRSTLTEEKKISVSIGKGDGSPAVVSSSDVKTRPLLAASSTGWKYLPATSVKGDGWRGLKFDDGAWSTGKAPIGYGEDEIGRRNGTTISDNGQDFLFRRAFEVPDALLKQTGTTFRLGVASDDSAVVYLNGEMLDEDPEADHEFSYWNRELDIPAKRLKAGKNVIAVLVKNKAGSSDLYMDLEVTARSSK